MAEQRAPGLHSPFSVAPGPARKRPRIVAVTGGKGGVGKTAVAVNLALSYARRGYRVLLLDADTDLANVSIVLGQYPSSTLEQVVSGECALTDAIMEGAFGLHVLPGAAGVQKCGEVDPEQALEVLRGLSLLERDYDLILIDTASGLQPTGLHMVASAMLACVVITPDPASLTDAFSLLRALQRRGYRRTPAVVVNMASGASQAQDVFRRFSGAVRRHLAMDVDYLGAIWRDETVRQSVQMQRPVAVLAETDPSCRQFLNLADRLDLQLARTPERKSGFAAYWHHKVRRQQQDNEEPAGKAVAGAPDSGGRNVRRTTVSSSAGTSESPLSRPPEAVSDRFVDAPVDECRQLFGQVRALLQAHEGDLTLRNEALREAAALILNTVPGEAAATPDASVPPTTRHPAASAPAFDEDAYGDQQQLLRRLRSQPPGTRLDTFLGALTPGYDQ